MARSAYVNPHWRSQDPSALCLGDYLQAIGDDHGKRLCQGTGLSPAIFRRIEDGEPVAASYVVKIAQWLSQEFERDIAPKDINGLVVLNPGRDTLIPSEAADGSIS